MYDAANDRVELDGADTVYLAINAGTFAQITLLKEVTSDADSPAFVNVDSIDTATNGGDITLQWNGEGIIQLTV